MAGHQKQILKHRQRGFTIVELLIVIIVIAILAAIVIVAYNGIQQRAQITSAYTTVRSYAQAFRQIDIDGNLPTINACLGPASAYPSGCSIGGQNGTTQSSVNNLLTNKGMANQPVLPTSSAQSIMYAASYYGAQGVLLFNLPGNSTDCGIQPVMSPDGSGTWGFYGAKNSIANTGPNNAYTYCVVGVKTT